MINDEYGNMSFKKGGPSVFLPKILRASFFVKFRLHLQSIFAQLRILCMCIKFSLLNNIQYLLDAKTEFNKSVWIKDFFFFDNQTITFTFASIFGKI
jgi:hypothetical protein